MITNTDLWVIKQLFERLENEEISSDNALERLKEYIKTATDDNKKY